MQSSLACAAGWSTKAAWILWLLVLLVIAARVAVRPGKGSVYPTFARAAACWRSGTDVYLLTDLDRVSCNAFRYSPLAAAFLVPFSYVPDGVGEILWRLLNAGVLLGGVTWWAVRDCRDGLRRASLPPCFCFSCRWSWATSTTARATRWSSASCC